MMQGDKRCFYNEIVNSEMNSAYKESFNTKSMKHPMFGHKPCWFCIMRALGYVIFAIFKNYTGNLD